MAETVAKMKKAVSVASASAEQGRKRKVDSGGEVSYATSLVQLGRSRSRRRRVVNFVKPENSAENNSDDPCASCCSSNGSSVLENKDSSKFVDLEVEVEEEEEEEGSVELATSTYELENCCRERRETTPSSEVQAESGRLEEPMSSEPNSSRRRSADDDQEKQMPSEAELEEFFSAAEKNLQQKFAQKYNFDVVQEEPLEGRYEWVRVKP